MAINPYCARHTVYNCVTCAIKEQTGEILAAMKPDPELERLRTENQRLREKQHLLELTLEAMINQAKA